MQRSSNSTEDIADPHKRGQPGGSIFMQRWAKHVTNRTVTLTFTVYNLCNFLMQYWEMFTFLNNLFPGEMSVSQNIVCTVSG